MGKNKIGRPTKLTPKLKDEICSRIAHGESLVRILKSNENFPDYTNVMQWLRKDELFRQNYTKAKEDQADYLAEEIIDIADDGSNDWMERHDKDNPGWSFNGEHYQRSRLRVDTRKWVASKMKPKRYGDSMKLEGDSDNPLSLGVILYPTKKKIGEK